MPASRASYVVITAYRPTGTEQANAMWRYLVIVGPAVYVYDWQWRRRRLVTLIPEFSGILPVSWCKVKCESHQ